MTRPRSPTAAGQQTDPEARLSTTMQARRAQRPHQLNGVRDPSHEPCPFPGVSAESSISRARSLVNISVVSVWLRLGSPFSAALGTARSTTRLSPCYEGLISLVFKKETFPPEQLTVTGMSRICRLFLERGQDVNQQRVSSHQRGRGRGWPAVRGLPTHPPTPPVRKLG